MFIPSRLVPVIRRSIAALAVFSLASMTSPVQADDWLQWRGPNRDGVSKETGLAKQWPEAGPAVAWTVDSVGDSYSSLAVFDGRILTMGNVEGEGRIICLDEKTGEVVWSIKTPAETKGFTHGKGNGARGTPTIDEGRVFTIGGGGDVTCVNIDTGSVIWSKHLVSDFGGSVPGWGYSESALIDGNNVIITPGGNAGCIVALDKKTGDVIWQSKDVTDKAHYCSAIIAESHGVRQIIQFTGGTGRKREETGKPRVIGVDATNGSFLWGYDKSGNGTANVATPIFANDKVFSSSGYGTGGGLVALAKTAEGFIATESYFERSMQNHHGGIVLVDGHMYGFGSGGLLCMNFESGEITWRDRSVQKGSLVYADGHLYCYGEKNEVALVEANPKEYVEKGRFSVAQKQHPTWAHPVVANGKFYLRDMSTLTCYNVKAE